MDEVSFGLNFFIFCVVSCEVRARYWSISVFNSYIPTIFNFKDIGYDPTTLVLISVVVIVILSPTYAPRLAASDDPIIIEFFSTSYNI